MIADLIADGDHDGYTALINAAMPVIWGHDIEVPERMLKFIIFTAGDQAAKIFNPGAVISGFKTNNKDEQTISVSAHQNWKSLISTVGLTFKIPGVKEFGPFEENAAILGAGFDPNIAFVGKINDLGFL